MIEEKEELDVQETRQKIGPNSYDDNWNLVGYTSELRDRNNNFFALLILMQMALVELGNVHTAWSMKFIIN